MASFRVEKTQPNGKTEALSRLYKLLQKQDSRLVPTWVSHLEQLLTDAGLCSTHVDKRNATGCLAFAMHECNMMVPEGLARGTGSAALSKELQKLMSDVAIETRDGAWWGFTRWTVVGNKPLRREPML